MSCPDALKAWCTNSGFRIAKKLFEGRRRSKDTGLRSTVNLSLRDLTELLSQSMELAVEKTLDGIEQAVASMAAKAEPPPQSPPRSEGES